MSVTPHQENEYERVLREGQVIHEDMMKTIAQTFEGIPVIVSKQMRGMQYCICVSRELFDELKKREGKTKSNEII